MSTKDSILRMLEDNRDIYLSGSKMAQELGVTRAGVWKAIKTLEEEGYQIEAVTNKGYRLSDGNEKLSEYSILRQLETEELGKKLYLLPSVDSTNNYAKTLAANGAPHGTAVVAEMQTGRSWAAGTKFFVPGWCGYVSKRDITARRAERTMRF